jgi:light-regulated signal transduction histidine kinase (bacteriophytochrome)
VVSPLISIAQFSQVLLNHDLGPLTDRQEDLLGRMRISGLQAKRIIDDLRDLADVTHREVFAEEVKISVMATFIIDDLVVPATDCDGMFIIRPDLRDYGDPALVRTFLVNLLQNAWKYTDCEDRTVLEMTCERGPLRNVFHIKDNDIGCDNTHHERIFEAFEQLHSEKDFAGTGFGIATASRVTRRHAGGGG